MSSPPNFVIITPAYNVRPFLGAWMASLALQKYTNWQAVFIDDASTDGTLDMLDSLLNAHQLREKIRVVNNSERQGRARNLFHAIRDHQGGNDVMTVLDGDDHLAADDCLNRFAQEYAQGWEVVWSNWRGTDGRPGTCSYLNPFISPRQQDFVSGHLFTFRRRLFDALTERDLQDDAGRWLPVASDVALALPILDQTIKRKHIPQMLLIYNRHNPLSHARKAGHPPAGTLKATPLQAKVHRMVIRRPPKPLTVDRDFLHQRLYDLLHSAAQSERVAARRHPK